METIELAQLWTVAGVLAGLQSAALIWRINREITMESEDERTWLTLPDAFAAVSFFILGIGVFLIPLSHDISNASVAKLLGTSIVVFAAYPFVLAGHYNLYCSWDVDEPRDRTTKQEWMTFAIAILLIAGGILWIWT